MNKSLFFVLITSIFIFAGCSQNLAHFSMASTGNLPITNLEKGNYVTGQECITFILGIPIGNFQNRVSVAVSNALENASKAGFHADALTNVDISVSAWSILLFGQNCVTAKGLPVVIKNEK